MNVAILLDMVASAFADRVAYADDAHEITYGRLQRAAASGARIAVDAGADAVVFLGTNGPSFPIALFSAAMAGIPLLPLNYRSSDEQVRTLASNHGRVLAVVDPGSEHRMAGVGAPVLSTVDWFAHTTSSPETERLDVHADGDAVALVLYTSGTTSAPKAAILRHRHLWSYVVANVEFGVAEPDDAALVSVPPYHIAGVSNALSNLFAARRVRYLADFDPQRWVELARSDGITHALVVPTMLAGITAALEGAGLDALPRLRSLAYGGARMPATVLERALDLLPGTDFVNAYGLTETSSTVALLGPDDHREAAASDDPRLRARLSSAGRVVDGVQIEVRDAAGVPLPHGAVGEIHVRGAQVAGEYATGSATDDDGWFPTRDRGWVDADGYLFIEGRSDDTIIRGGENVAPAEIEEVLRRHPAVADAAVVGLPDERWGHRIAAVVVAAAGLDVDTDDVRAFVRERLRSSKTPDEVVVWDALPHTATGKLLRRQVVEALDER